MAFQLKSKLPRLAREWYRGRAVVFWTHTLEGRATGWLNEKFHHEFRETLIHAGGRYALACPIYVLMPDHWHLVWMGLNGESDQTLATRFLREHLRGKLQPAQLQDRAHDHVARDEERKRGAFGAMCEYVRENPVRAGLVTAWRDWAFTGAVVPGYPDFDPREESFRTDFWKVYGRLVEGKMGGEVPALPRRATGEEEGKGAGG